VENRLGFELQEDDPTAAALESIVGGDLIVTTGSRSTQAKFLRDRANVRAFGHQHPFARARSIDDGHRALGADTETFDLNDADRCFAPLATASLLSQRLGERRLALRAEPPADFLRTFGADQNGLRPV
ncbi:hypothetical protein, partial [Escherichia coli]|uniref:hypothetical protein n=1 Tax=Escherichia coli TaxID=562 RepID=UPI001BFC2222